MKKFLLSFLSLAMMLVGGCVEEVTFLNENQVSQPTFVSALDDVTFGVNFSILDIKSTSFIIDPGDRTITKDNFEVVFNDDNYMNPEDGTYPYLTAVVTESSSTNGYSVRFYPTDNAVNLVEEYTASCNLRIYYDGDKYTQYPIYITFSADAPKFDDHPTSCYLSENFTADSLMYTTFSLLPGQYDIKLEDITLSNSSDNLYSMVGVEVDESDTTGNTYIITLKPTTKAVNLTDYTATTSYVIVYYTDATGATNSIESYEFDIEYEEDYIVLAVVGGVPDITLPENFLGDKYGLTYHYYDSGSHSDGGYVHVQMSSTQVYVYNFIIEGGDDYLVKPYADSYGITTIGNYVTLYEMDEVGYILNTAKMFTGVIWLSTTSSVARYIMNIVPSMSAKEIYEKTGSKESIVLDMNMRFITDITMYRASIDADKEAGGTGVATEAFIDCPFTLTLPPYNDNVTPTFSTTLTTNSYASQKMVRFHSDFENEVQQTPSVTAGAAGTDLSYTYKTSNAIWELDTDSYSIDYNDPYGWIDQAGTTMVSADTDESTGTYADGIQTRSYTLKFKPSLAAVAVRDQLTAEYYAGYDANDPDTPKFAMDTGVVSLRMKVDYNKDAETGKFTKSVYSDYSNVRYFPSTPTDVNEEGTQLLINSNYTNNAAVFLHDIWISHANESVFSSDGTETSTFTWNEAKAVCENKEKHPVIPWGWRLPSAVEMRGIAFAKYTACAGTFVTNDSEDAIYEWYWTTTQSSSYSGTAQAVTPITTGSAVNRDTTYKYRVRCVIDKFQYPDSEFIPDVIE